jgi:hypothetical protein
VLHSGIKQTGLGGTPPSLAASIIKERMGDLVFLSGDFCSGSTLLFTLFRETGDYGTPKCA